MTFTSLNFPPQMIKIFKSNLHLIFILILLVGFSFYPALNNDFVQWDDQFYVTDNPLISNPTFENLKILFTKIISLNYHPLTMITIWTNAYLSGIESAAPFILTNIIFHILNTALIFLFVKKLIHLSATKKKKKSNPSFPIVAFTTALIFGIHPMHVESVVWVSERKDVLYAFFLLLASWQYLIFIEKKKTKNYAFTLLFFLCSCLSKAMAVSFAPLLYLIDYYVVRDFKKKKIHLEKIPFFILSMVIGLIAINVQAGGDLYGWLESSYDDKALSTSFQIGLMEKIKLACFGLFFYLKKFLFPFDLAAIHPYSIFFESKLASFLPILGLVLLGSIGYFFKRNKSIVFGISYFLITVFLVLQLIPVGSAVVAERYSYLPYIGLGFLVGTLFKKYWKGNIKYGIAGVLLFLSAYFSYLTRNQVDTWKNQISLFENAIEVYPNHPTSREFLATGYWLKGDLDKAIQQLDFAINQLNYQNSNAYELLATCHDDKNQPDTALVYYNKALELEPNNFVAHYHRGLLLIDLDPKAALDDFIFCKKSKSDYLQKLIQEPMARTYGILGNHQSALNHFNQAIEYEPENPMIYFNRGVNHEKMNNFDLAIEDYAKAVQLDNNLEMALQRIDILKKHYVTE